MQLTNICPYTADQRFLMLVSRKVAMLRAFTVGFEKASKICLVLLVALPSLIDTLYTVASLMVPPIIFHKVATKVLGTELFP